ncbi:unnamed protein product [Mytilus edulis]|uniref:Ig-like domain-containing protein n=1 Tax=Mytilus edulis TaxID=6550 RepID=A0A8S3SWK2_MYTED|nr:unnamed protein product [Mytilus edulis]
MDTYISLLFSVKPYPPRFSSDSVNTEENKPLVISCTSTGSRPKASIYWLLGDGKTNITAYATQLPPSHDPTTDTYSVTSTLTYSMHRIYNGKYMICGARNEATLEQGGGVETSKTLNITYAPDITVNSSTYTQNDAIRKVICNPSGNPNIYTYHKWQHKSRYGEIIREFNGNKTLTLPDVPVLLRYQDSGSMCVQLVMYRVQGSSEWTIVSAWEEDINEQRRRRTYEVRNLQEGKAYELRMYAENTAMKSNFTDVLIVFTKSSVSTTSSAVIGTVVGVVVTLVIVCASFIVILLIKRSQEDVEHPQSSKTYETLGTKDKISVYDDLENIKGVTSSKSSMGVYEALGVQEKPSIYAKMENQKGSNLLFTNIDVSQDNLEEDHKEEHVLDNEEDIEEVTEEDHVVDHEKDHMEDIEEEHKVFQSALDKLSDEGKRERFLIFFISGRFPLKQHCIRPVFGHC